MAKKRAPKQKRVPKDTSSAAAQKQKQTQIVNVHVGSAKRARGRSPLGPREGPRRPAKRQPKKDVGKAQSAPLYAFNPPPIINFPPGFAPQNQPNAWATPPPPIPQRQRAAFVEGEVAELLNQPKTEPVRLTFEGSIAEKLEPRKEATPLEAPAARDEVANGVAVPSLFEPPTEFGFTEPEPVVEPEFSAEEIARNEAALAREARAAELAAEEEALAEDAVQRRILAEGVKTMASFAAAERGAAAAAAASTLPFSAEPVLPTTAEELVGQPVKPKKKYYVAEGPIVPVAARDPRYRYTREGRQKFTLSGMPITQKSKETELPFLEASSAADPRGGLVGYANAEPFSGAWDVVPSGAAEPLAPPGRFAASNALPPLVTVRSSESVNREPYPPISFLGSSSLRSEGTRTEGSPPEKPSGLERQRREGFSGKSGSGSVLSGAEETLLSGSAVSANWPHN